MTVSPLSPPAIDTQELRHLLQQKLEGRELIATPQHHSCELAVVTPVYDEAPRRIIAQLLSFLNQGVGDQIEVILVVNNGPDDGTPEWQSAYGRNQAVLNLPIFRNCGSSGGDAVTRRIRDGLAVYVIDQSSPGHQVPGNNVGIARQRGLAEATTRFAQQSRNGLVMHTDADCWYEDPTFVDRLLWLFDFYPELLGISGDYGLQVEVDDPEAAGLADKVEQHKLLRRYRALYRAITDGIVHHEAYHKALGRCIVHRAYEGIVVGGIEPINLNEDVNFGEALSAYAAANGLRFEHGSQWRLGPVSAMRISERTGNDTLLRNLARMNADGGDPVVDDAFNPGTLVVLDEMYMQRLITAVRQMPNGEAHLEWLFVTSALARIRVK